MYQFYVNDNDIQQSILLKISSCGGDFLAPEVVAKSYSHESNDIQIDESFIPYNNTSLFPKSVQYPVDIICENEDHRGNEVVVFRVESLGYFVSYDGIIRHYGIDSAGAIRALSMYM